AILRTARQVNLAAVHLVSIAVGESLPALESAFPRHANRRLGVGTWLAGDAAAAAMPHVPGGVHAFAVACFPEGRAAAHPFLTGLPFEAGVAARTAVLDARARVHAGAIAEFEVSDTDAFTVHAVLPFDTRVVASPAVEPIGGGVHAGLAADHEPFRAVEDAGPVDAEAVFAADDSARTAVLSVREGIDAGALAFEEALPASARTFPTDAVCLTLRPAGAAIRRVAAGVHAGAVALGHLFGTDACALAADAIRLAGHPAATAVFRIDP